MKRQVEVIKPMPGTIVGDIFTVTDMGNIECSQYAVEYLIREGWVKEVEEESLAVRFNNVWESNNYPRLDRLFDLFASMANVHYLRIFDDAIEKWKTSFIDPEIKLDVFIRNKIKKG